MNDKDKQHRSEEFQELTSKIDRLEKIALLGAKNVLTIDDVALITGFHERAHISPDKRAKNPALQAQRTYSLFQERGNRRLDAAKQDTNKHRD